MGFKSMPWELYFKPSLGEFVIRQKHTVHTSGNVAQINGKLKALRGSANAPARVARANAIKEGYSHWVYKYVNGQRKKVLAADIRAFKAELRNIMALTVTPIVPGDPTPAEEIREEMRKRGGLIPAAAAPA